MDSLIADDTIDNFPLVIPVQVLSSEQRHTLNDKGNYSFCPPRRERLEARK